MGPRGGNALVDANAMLNYCVDARALLFYATVRILMGGGSGCVRAVIVSKL